MKRILKKFKTLGLITMIAGGALTMAACSKAEKQARNNLNETMKDRINEQRDEKAPLSFEVDRYEFLGADFNKTGDVYSVELSGVIRNKDKDKTAYINAGINLETSKVGEIQNSESLSEVLGFLNEAVKNHEFEYLEVLSVENVKALSSAVVQSLEAPSEGFSIGSGMLYGLSKPEINHEEGFAVFQTKNYAKFTKTTVQITFGVVGKNQDGSAKFGTVTRTVVQDDFYIQTANVYVKATAKELIEMEKNPQLVYDKFVELEKNKDKSKYVIQSVELQKTKDFNTNMFPYATLSIEK